MQHLCAAPAGWDGPAAVAGTAVTDQLVAALTDLRARIAALDDRISETLALHVDAHVFTSLPRAGTVRAALLLAADSRHASPWAADIYTRARARGARHPHAVRILARAWCRVIWRCWTDNTPYNPTQHGGYQRLQPATG